MNRHPYMNNHTHHFIHTKVPPYHYPDFSRYINKYRDMLERQRKLLKVFVSTNDPLQWVSAHPDQQRKVFQRTIEIVFKTNNFRVQRLHRGKKNIETSSAVFGSYFWQSIFSVSYWTESRMPPISTSDRHDTIGTTDAICNGCSSSSVADREMMLI